MLRVPASFSVMGNVVLQTAMGAVDSIALQESGVCGVTNKGDAGFSSQRNGIQKAERT